MRTVPYRRVLEGAVALAGLDLDEMEGSAVNAWIQWLFERLKVGWSAFRWPEACAVERLYYQQGLWASGNTYGAGAIVYHGEQYWVAQVATIEEPGASVQWAAIRDFRRFVRFYPMNRDLPESIMGPGFPNAHLALHSQSFWPDVIYGCYRDDPREVGNPRPVPFSLIADAGVDFGRDAPDFVWCLYRRVLYEFYGKVVDLGINYTKWSQFYDHGSGEFWLVSGDPVPTDPPIIVPSSPIIQGGKLILKTSPQTAQQLTSLGFPYFLESYAKAGAYADWLLDQGQMDKFSGADRKADRILENEMMKLLGQQRQLPRTRYGVARR